ncbi:DUF6316 family protein [Marinobacter salarius]|jgi:hypothetical protein|uniref:DUF6316 family protein n=1 Tax=Marinobacter salarius TaxID=1420917 RepID=UPI001D0FADFC
MEKEVTDDGSTREAERNWFRFERFELINGAWYFQTREGALKRLCENSLRSWQNNRDMARGYFL